MDHYRGAFRHPEKVGKGERFSCRALLEPLAHPRSEPTHATLSSPSMANKLGLVAVCCLSSASLGRGFGRQQATVSPKQAANTWMYIMLMWLSICNKTQRKVSVSIFCPQGGNLPCSLEKVLASCRRRDLKSGD